MRENYEDSRHKEKIQPDRPAIEPGQLWKNLYDGVTYIVHEENIATNRFVLCRSVEDDTMRMFSKERWGELFARDET